MVVMSIEQSTTSHPAHTLSKKHNDHDLKQQIHPNVCNHGGNQEVEQKTEIGSKQLETKGLYGEVLQCLENNDPTKLKLLCREDILEILSRMFAEKGGKESIIKSIEMMSKKGQLSEPL